ncbi:glycosyltransferase family 10 domain-containing protein [Neorhizobium sp. SOG26]|uniref:glycosyltransferase family 10 domain-containing protein n=1 Tax=Neorhizobium sp. SOG26 TaxID=2060726 RepID=UPI0019005225|nr:glycosyltransferase family 10 [Neorhizobium sp. SOG26]
MAAESTPSASRANFNGDWKSNLIRAAFVSSSPGWDWRRQFPDRVPEWDGVRFSFEPKEPAYDVLFVYDAVPHDMKLPTAGFRVFIASEPAAIKQYLPRFLAQFDLVLTTDAQTVHPNMRVTQPGVVWHAGAWDASGALKSVGTNWNDFAQLRPAKTKQISIVSSNKAYTQGHRDRLQFVERAKAYFGDELHVFGRGINTFADKLEVLEDYRYHIALENSVFDHYWTEKLADPFLTLTYPLYHGSQNVHDYFPKESLTRIAISDADGAIRIIKRILESDTAERSLPYLEEARRRVLNEHNLFSILAGVAKDVAGQRGTVQVQGKQPKLKPERAFRPKGAKLRNSIAKRFVKVARLFQ